MGRKLGYFPSATLPAGGRVRSRSSTMPRATYIPSYATNAGFSRADSLAYDTRLDDYMVQGRISDVNYLSQATLEDEYNTANRSRALDAQLRRNFSNAIEGSNSYATPQVSRVARSVARRTQCRAASVPPRPVSSQPKMTERKAIRTDDGYTKPKNIMSWQYRVESMVSPKDLLIQPSSLIRIRDQVQGVQLGMDRHRQLLDRYLADEDSGDVVANIMRKSRQLEGRYSLSGASDEATRPRSTVNVPAYYATGVDPRNPPMSDLRRRIKRTLNKTRHS